MFRLVFSALFATLLLASGPAAAQGRRAPSDNAQTLDRMLPQIRSRYPGTFYDAEGPYPGENGASHYRLKWMTPQGRIIWLDTDARTGRVLGVQQGPARAYPYGAPPPYAMPPRGAYPMPGRNFGGYGLAPRGYYGTAPRGGYWGGRGGAPRGWGGRGHHGG